MEILLNTLKWSVAVGGAALVLTLLKPLLDKRYSAKWRYGAWLLMAVLLLQAPVLWGELLPQAPVEPPVIIQVPRVEVSVSRNSGLSLDIDFRPSQITREKPDTSAFVLSLETILALLWLSVAAAILLYHLAGTWRFTRRAKRWSCPAEEDVCQVYVSVCREMGLRKAPPLYVSAMAGSPMVAGLFRPRLLLPEQEFESQALAFIFRHELTHYRRRDLWYKLILLAANALHWFNPLIWLLRREAEKDLELTCDDAVIAGADSETRRAYSEALMASIRPQCTRSVLSTHFYGGKNIMKERFRNILGKRGRKWGAAVLAVALLATVGPACAFGVRSFAEGSGLSAEELAEWQARIDSPEMRPYLCRMYTDPALLPPEELLDGASQTVQATVTSGTRNGSRVSLDLEGSFPNGLTQGTLILEDSAPVYFATPLYAAVESEARKFMDQTAEDYISISGDLEFPEKYITDLRCIESMTFDGTAYYVWTLQYRMRPNDMGSVVLAGGMDAESSWLTEQSSMGFPCFIFSVDQTGAFTLEAQDWTTRDGALTGTGFTWEEYLYCKLHLGLENIERGVYNGWPQSSASFLESLRNGHDTWATDWEDTALTYLSQIYGLTAKDGLTLQRTFQADGDANGHTQALLVRADCGSRTALLLLTENVRPSYFWQVAGEKWTPSRPPEVPVSVQTEDSISAPASNLPDTEPIPAPTSRPDTPEPVPTPQPDTGASEEQSSTGVTAIPEPAPNIRTPTGTIGDFDGDGVRDEWVWINGFPHRVLVDPNTGDVSFDPPAPEVWENVYAGVWDPESGDVIFAPSTPEIGGNSTGVTAIPEPAPNIRTPTGTIGDFDGDGVRDETVIPEPAPNIRTSTGTIGDYDGDGIRDEEIWIDGVYHRVIFDPDTHDIRFEPEAPEYWGTVSTTPPEG